MQDAEAIEKVREAKRAEEVKEKYQNLILAIPNVMAIRVGGISKEQQYDNDMLTIVVKQDGGKVWAILAKEIDGVKVNVVEIPPVAYL